MDAEAFQENFSCLSRGGKEFFTDTSSVDCDDAGLSPRSDSYHDDYPNNFTQNETITSPLKAFNSHKSEKIMTVSSSYCGIKSEGGGIRLNSSGRKYSHRRATTERRNRINERERDRMHQLCDAFEKLRTVLPYKRSKRGPNRQKMSKIATLLLAQNYIRTLEDMLRRPAEYTNPNASASVVATANIMSHAFAASAAGMSAVSDRYSSCAVAAGGSGGILESAYGVSAVAQEIDPSQYYYIHGYHDYNFNSRMLPEHAYHFL